MRHDAEQQGTPPSVWERSRRMASREILDTALRLFTTQGYEETTIAQIAREAGVSQRTLFRYFGAKEELAFGDLAAHGETLRAALEARPADESPWTALRAAFMALGDSLPYSPEDIRTIVDMLRAAPSLRARQLERRQQWTELLATDIARRLAAPEDPLTPLRARALVSCALACADLATETWARSGGEVGLERAFDEAVAAVRTERPHGT